MGDLDKGMADCDVSKAAEPTKADTTAPAGTTLRDVMTPAPSEPDYSSAMYLLLEFIEHLVKYAVR
jgi:hypothetical protein